MSDDAEVRSAFLQARHTSNVFRVASNNKLMFFTNFDIVMVGKDSDGKTVENLLTDKDYYRQEVFIDDADEHKIPHTNKAIVNNGAIRILYRGLSAPLKIVADPKQIIIDKSAYGALKKGNDVIVRCVLLPECGRFHFRGIRKENRHTYLQAFLEYVSRLNNNAIVTATAADDD